MSQNNEICIVVLIGLPGSGKSTFCQLYKKHLETEPVNVVHVSYDDIIPLEKQAEMATGQEEDGGKWKKERENIVTAVEKFIHHLKAEDDQTNLDCQLKKQFKDVVKGKRTLVLIDDNNYLRSMRYYYHQVARKCQVGFCQLFFQAGVSDCKQLNSKRQEHLRVPDKVIETMAAKLEQPNPFKNSWESFSFTIPLTVGDKVEWNYEMVDSVVNLGFDNPVKPLPDNSLEKEASRVACDASLVHQADKLLRSFVNKKMKEERDKKASKDVMKEASVKLYAAKTELLEDLRTGFTKLDKDLVKNMNSKEESSERKFEQEIDQLFLQKLKLS